MIEESDTLCNTCRKACKGTEHCSWAGALIPVDGWKAEETKNGYRVIHCPLYSPGRGLPRNIDTGGMMRLMEAAAYQMRNDYIQGIDIYSDKDREAAREPEVPRMERKIRNRKTIEHWLKNGGAALMGISNPEEVIQMLRKMARRHDEEIAKLMSR